MKTLLALAALVCFANLPCASAAQDCPDTCATQVPGYVDGSALSNQCFIGITLFGWEFGISLGHCPLHQLVYPAHQSCEGKYNEGTACTAGDDLEVRLLRCRCRVLGGSSLGVGVGGCDCEDVGASGSVEDAKTTNCVD